MIVVDKRKIISQSGNEVRLMKFRLSFDRRNNSLRITIKSHGFGGANHYISLKLRAVNEYKYESLTSKHG